MKEVWNDPNTIVDELHRGWIKATEEDIKENNIHSIPFYSPVIESSWRKDNKSRNYKENDKMKTFFVGIEGKIVSINHKLRVTKDGRVSDYWYGR